MSEEQKRKLEQHLWNIANTLRGKMNADEFRDYILGFIFYKYLSEKMHLFANKLLSEDSIDYGTLNEAKDDDRDMILAIKEEALNNLGYFLAPHDLFHALAVRGADEHGVKGFILEDLARILNSIEQSTLGTESEEDFEGLFAELDLASSKLGKTPEAKNALIAKVLGHLDQIDFLLEDSQIDILGDAYEYLIAQFASGAGKKAGEFYTPQEVSTILAKIVTTDRTRIKHVYDPTCGSGSLLLRVAKEVKEVGAFFGQEMNRTTFNLARMNMILHDVHFTKFDIRQEDTLEAPQHRDMRFEAIVANPPFSAEWSANPLHMSDERFAQYGKLAPKSKADYAFITHMIHQLDENGTMATVMPHGALFRGNAEGHIREYIIKNKNYLDAVIGLPANIFYGTSIPTCIMVFKKCRQHDDNVLFIDASNEFDKSKNQSILRPTHISKIIDTYRERKEIERFSHLASLEEIAENDYNLNIPRYVDTFEEEEHIDVNAVATRIREIDIEIGDVDQTIKAFCDELGIEAPM